MSSCVCARDVNGAVTSTLFCAVHSPEDPCLRVTRITGRRRKGTIRRGVCTHCGWGS